MNQPLSMDQVFLNKITAIIEANLENEKFGAGELSHELGMSRSNINRKLRSIYKNSISQLIQEIRLQRAMEMLQQMVGTAAEVAYKVGFSSPTYFNKCFHEYYGFPPGEVKKLEEYDREKAKQLIIPEAIAGRYEQLTIKKEWPNRKSLILRVSIIALFVMLALLSFFYFFNDTLFQRKPNADYITITDADKSIAILPFKNLSQDPEQDWFSEGMTEEILNHLFKIGGLKIPSSISTKRFKDSKLSVREIARKLGVSYVLEGSVSRSEDNVRVIARLINGKNEKIIWSKDYKLSMTALDILEIQSDVALQVAESLKLVIDPEVKQRIKVRPTENIEAYTLYQQAMYTGSNQQGIQMLERAVLLDPGFADAYSVMAYWQMWRISDSLNREQMLEKVEPLLNKALQLDRNSIQAHLAFAELRLWFYWDFETVEKEIQIFRQLSPSNTEENFSIIQCLWALGRFHEAYMMIKEGFEQYRTFKTEGYSGFNWSGKSELIWVYMAKAYFYIGEKERALETIETALRLFPHNLFVIRHALDIFVCTARYEEAIGLFEKNIKDLNDTISSSAGIAYFKTGNKSKANAILNEKLSRKRNIAIDNSLIGVAELYVAMNENDKALQCLEKAYTYHESGLVYLKTEYLLQPLHGDPRFEDLLVKIGFK